MGSVVEQVAPELRGDQAPQVDLAGMAAVFAPGDPARSSRFVFWDPDDPAGTPKLVGQVVALREQVELVLPAGRSIRRRSVRAATIAMPTAMEMFSSLPVQDDLDETVLAWASVVRCALALVARGRLVPAMSAEGYDEWHAWPIDADDDARLGALADRLPPQGAALLDMAVSARALAVREPRDLVGAAVNAVADTLVRTAAAPLVTTSRAFAGPEPVVVADWPGWLEAAARGGGAEGSRPVLRLDMTTPGADTSPDHDEAASHDEVVPPITATLQVRSVIDPSLIIDATDLWDAPAVVLERLGDEAETDLLLALRRGARVWAPLGRALEDARPSTVDLDDDEVAELFGPVAARLTTAGFDVLWPSQVLGGGLALQAVASSTPTPAAVTSAGFDMAALLDFRWRVALDGSELSAEEVESLAEAKRPLVRLRGRWVVADTGLLEKLRRPPRPLRQGDALAAALAGSVEVDGELVEIEVEGPLADLATRLQAVSAVHEREEPDGLNGVLRPYQRRGLAWLVEMTDLGVGGCLADDMGLGKTIQLIAVHLHRRGQDSTTGEHLPTLVVCPASVLGNWEREVKRFAPTVAVRRYHGGQRSLEALAADEIVLATYGVVRRDDQLATIDWGMVVADEAQNIKNPLSRTARALRTIPAKARIALTGTPVENRLTELWAILDWTTPGLLGPLEEFRRQVAIPIERHRDPDATERLAQLVKPFLLRRKKSDPAIAPELPPKTETDAIVALTDEQMTLYDAVAKETLAQIADAEGISRRGLVLKLITALKQVANHPAHFLHEKGPLPGRSGKLTALDELLEVILAEGDSVLVFTQYVEMAKLLQTHLTTQQVPNLFLHGRVPVAKRQGMVDDFQAGRAPVFLLSLKAAGVGLNLTRATHVVHYDRWWNPAVEDQATDRAYRIGQDRPVQVHRLISEGTIEDHIASLLESKRALADAVVGAGEAWLTELSDDELSELVIRDVPSRGSP